jgi:hypothetical protein
MKLSQLTPLTHVFSPEPAPLMLPVQATEGFNGVIVPLGGVAAHAAEEASTRAKRSRDVPIQGARRWERILARTGAAA